MTASAERCMWSRRPSIAGLTPISSGPCEERSRQIAVLERQRTGLTIPDMVIADLVLSEAELIERVRGLEVERDVYRAVVRESLHLIHRLTQQNSQLKTRLFDLLDERRASPARTAA